LYKVGDKGVYPHHGAGAIVKKESGEALGQKREYLTIKILHNDMTVQVPCENADAVGLRRVIGEKEVGVVLKALTGGSTDLRLYDRLRDEATRDKFRLNRLLQRVVAWPALANAVARRLSRRRDLADRLVGIAGDFVPARTAMGAGFLYEMLKG